MNWSSEAGGNSPRHRSQSIALSSESGEKKIRWSQTKKIIGRFTVAETDQTIEESISIWTFGLRSACTHDFVDVSKGAKQPERQYSHAYLETVSLLRDQAEEEFRLLPDTKQESYRYYYYLLKGGNTIPLGVNLSSYRPFLEQLYLEYKFNEPLKTVSSP